MNASRWPRFLVAAFFVGAGLGHFIWPNAYLAIMPAVGRWSPDIVIMSGIAEICGGIGLLPRVTRRWAGWGLIALLVAVFPANINALSTGMTIAGHALPAWLLWARLPLQIPLIFWVYWVSLRCRKPTPD